MNMLDSRRNYLKYYKIYIPHQHTKFKCHFRMTKTISNSKFFSFSGGAGNCFAGGFETIPGGGINFAGGLPPPGSDIL
jgi:hypothetical protein